MSQVDYDIANQLMDAARTDLNLHLVAIASNNSGLTEPATTFAYMWWPDTTTGIMKQRNAANSAWIEIFTLSTGTNLITGAEIKALYEGETNAYTNALNTKLGNIETAATQDQSGAEIKALYEAQANAYTDALNTKLGNIETAATQDQTGAEIKALYEVLTNAFTDALFTKLGGISTGAEVNPDLVGLAEAQAGTATTERIWSALRVKNAIDALGGVSSSSVGQTELNTSTGDMTTTTILLNVTGPGGEYGFWPTVKSAVSLSSAYICVPATENEADGTAAFYALGTSYLQRFVIGVSTTSGSRSMDVRQRFVSASPPYDMGDGAVFSFIFVIINDATGLIESSYHAPDPPWANNGPTDIRPDRIDKKTGKKYKTVKSIGQDKTLLMNPDFIGETEIEITTAFKNSDMDLIPHPFTGNDLTGKTVVLLDPMSKVVERLEEMKNAGGDPSEILYGGYLNIGTTELNRGRPPGVRSVSIAMK